MEEFCYCQVTADNGHGRKAHDKEREERETNTVSNSSSGNDAALVALDISPETEHTSIIATSEVEAIYGDQNNDDKLIVEIEDKLIVEIEDLVSTNNEKDDDDDDNGVIVYNRRVKLGHVLSAVGNGQRKNNLSSWVNRWLV